MVALVRLLTLTPYDRAAGANVSLYLSDLGFRTGAGDTPASKLFRRGLTTWSITRDAWQPGTIGGASLPVRVRFTVATSSEWVRSGRLADYLAYAWSGWEFHLQEVEKTAPISEAVTIARGRIASMEPSGATLVFNGHDQAEDFRTAMQSAYYTGAGGFDGTTDLEGVPKPLVFGRVFNAEAVPVDPSLLWFDLHDGPIEAIDAVRDKGVDLPASMSNPPPSGYHYADLANGRFRLGADPKGKVTADVRGAKPGGSYKETLADVTRHLVTAYGGLADPAGLDTASFTALATARPGVVGFATGTREIDLSAALDALCGGQGVYWGFTRAGLYFSAAFTAATATASTDAAIARVIRKRNVVTGTAKRVEAGVPPWRVVPRYRVRGWVQDADALAEGVLIADRLAYSRDSDGVSGIEDTDISAAYPRSEPLTVTTYLYDRTRASAIGSALLALLDGLVFHRVRVKAAVGAIDLGAELWLEHDELGLAAGAAVRVAGITEDNTGFATVELAAT